MKNELILKHKIVITRKHISDIENELHYMFMNGKSNEQNKIIKINKKLSYQKGKLDILKEIKEEIKNEK